MKDTLEFLVHHGYIVLFASVLAQQVGLLLLSTPFIVAAGALAHSGHLSFGVTIFVAFCAARRNLSRSLHWTSDAWQSSTNTRSKATTLGIEFVDIQVPQQDGPIRFTFLWTEENRWEGKDYEVTKSNSIRTSGTDFANAF